MRKDEVKNSFVGFYFSEFHVGEPWQTVLDLHGEFVGWNDGGTMFEDFSQGGGIDAVFDVVCNPDLEEAFSFVSDGSPAVDEVLFRESDLGDVKVGRD